MSFSFDLEFQNKLSFLDMALHLFRQLPLRQSSFSLPVHMTRAWASQSTSSQSNQNTKTTSSGRFIPIILLTVAIYASYKMISNRSSDLRNNEHYQRATADYQKANAQGTDVKA